MKGIRDPGKKILRQENLSRPHLANDNDWWNLQLVTRFSVATLTTVCRNGVWKHLSLLKEMHRRTMAD